MAITSFVIKCGGSTLTALPDVFFEDLKKLCDQHIYPIIVHGGGPAITEMLDKLEIVSSFVNGLRVTNEATLDVVEMILGGKINKEIVRRIQSQGLRAIGLTGMDGHLIEAISVDNSDQIGYVGQVSQVNIELITQLIDMAYVPVIAPIGISAQGEQRYNINADTVAGAVASSMKATPLVIVTDVPGIMRSQYGEKTVMPEVTVAMIHEMIANGEIYGGMIPKVQAAIQCIQGDVEEVVIVHGSEPHILSKVLQGESVGTRIKK
jgi:acetylglutamate kinase